MKRVTYSAPATKHYAASIVKVRLPDPGLRTPSDRDLVDTIIALFSTLLSADLFEYLLSHEYN